MTEKLICTECDKPIKDGQNIIETEEGFMHDDCTKPDCLVCGKPLIEFCFFNIDARDKTPHYWHRRGYDCFESEILPEIFPNIDLTNDSNFTIGKTSVGIVFATKGFTERMSMRRIHFRALNVCRDCFMEKANMLSDEKVLLS